MLDGNSSENLNRTSSDSNTFTQFSIFQGKPAFFGSQASDETIDQKPKYGDYDLYVPYKSVISYRHIHNSGAPYQRTERSRAPTHAYNHCTCKLCVATFTCNCCYCANYQYYLNGATQHEYIDGIHASFWPNLIQSSINKIVWKFSGISDVNRTTGWIQTLFLWSIGYGF